MSSGVYLAGGGSAAQEAAVWEHMLEDVSRLLYWPTALSGELLQGAESWLRSALGDRPGLAVTTWLDLSTHRGEELDGFDLVFVGGGNTYDLVSRLRAADVSAALQRFLRRGGTYYGGSAGAVVAGMDVGLARGLDPDRHHDADSSGLGLVRADVLPHFAEPHLDRARTWSARHRDRPLLCIPEASGVWLTDERSVVLGPEPVDVYRGGSLTARCQAGDTVPLG